MFINSLSRQILSCHSLKSKLSRSFSSTNTFNMKLSKVCEVLEKFGPLSFAEKWDNVGLLIEPSSDIDVKKILLTNDLTENVMNEAIKENVQMILSYHPPIFQGLKRLTMNQWKERIVIQCLENKIAMYSPHTVWDAIPNGTSEWLANAVPVETMNPVVPTLVDSNYGAGRICNVKGELKLKDIIDRVKNHTEVPDVRVAIAYNSSLDSVIRKFACCPGSGVSILKETKEPIELFITGEMSHHELLDAASRNVNVIMLNHSNSERGYLKHFSKIFKNFEDSSNVEIIISKCDSDPLKTF